MVLSLSVEDFEQFWLSIPIIEAQETLRSFTAHDWPNLKKEDRKSIHKKLHEQSFPKAYDKETRQKTTKDIFNSLQGFMNEQ